jgi:ABC-type phosphate transport system substrate-binding protein
LRTFRSLLILPVLLALVLLVAPRPGVVRAESSSAPAAGFYVIINPQNPVTSVSRKFVMDAFLKKVTQWGDLFGIRPVDLRVDSSVRNAFSTELLKRSVSAVKTYWQQMVFSGRDVPPPELDSDEEVVRYVIRNPGGIGYVSPTASLQGVRVLTLK